MDRNRFERWQARLERGLARLLEKSYSEDRKSSLRETLDKSRGLAALKSPLSRLYNGLGELSLKAGFQLLAIILLTRSRKTDPRDPLPVVNLSRARLSLANRFLLRAPVSGAVAYNLIGGKKDLDELIDRGKLPEAKLVEATLLKRRIEDRLELWNDLRRGEVEPSRVRVILSGEDRELKPLMTGRLPSLAELEKLAPKRTGFYYREYREEQRRNERRR